MRIRVVVFLVVAVVSLSCISGQSVCLPADSTSAILVQHLANCASARGANTNAIVDPGYHYARPTDWTILIVDSRFRRLSLTG